MIKVVGIRFKKTGKVYFFDSGYIRLNLKDRVIVETAMGEEIGEVVLINKMIDEEKADSIKKIIRIANENDLKRLEENKKKEVQAFKDCKERIKKHNLAMNLVDVDYVFDNSKIIFYFTADGRIDFRDLVKDLASIYKTRIELRQIGVRDEVRKIGGNGVCGRQLCCCSFLNNFDVVSIKMAKEQSTSLNPSKITGNCGRLMCCLKYEQEVYEEKNKRLPKVGSLVKTEDGEGTVVDVEVLKETVKVQFDKEDVKTYKNYNASDVKIIKNINNKENSDDIDVEDMQELKRLEALEKQDKKNNNSKKEEY